MKASGLSLSIAVIAFGASTIYLAVQLSDERARSEELVQATSQLNARIAELEKARGQTQITRPGIFGAVNLPPGATLTAPPPLPSIAANSDAPKGGDPVARAAPMSLPQGEAFRKMMRSQIRASNRQLYADVGTQLGLSRDETKQLIDLLTEQQVAGIGVSQEVQDPDERQRLLQQAMRDNQAKINDLLGQEKVKQLEEYQRSIPARQEVDMLARQIEGSDVAALTADQRNHLVSVFMEERDRIPMPAVHSSASHKDITKVYGDWQSDYEARLAARARGILNAEQYAALEEYQQAQKEMRDEMNSRIQSGGYAGSVFINASPTIISGETAVVTSSSTEEVPEKAP